MISILWKKKCAAHYLEDAYLMTVNNKASNQQDTKRKFIQNDITFKTSHMTPQKEEKDEIVYLFRQKLFCDIIFQAVSPIFRYRKKKQKIFRNNFLSYTFDITLSFLFIPFSRDT